MPCYRKQPYKAGSECNVYLHTQQISINTGISLTKIPTKSHSKHRRQLSNFPCVRSPLSEPKTRRVKRGQAGSSGQGVNCVQYCPVAPTPHLPSTTRACVAHPNIQYIALGPVGVQWGQHAFSGVNHGPHQPPHHHSPTQGASARTEGPHQPPHQPRQHAKLPALLKCLH